MNFYKFRKDSIAIAGRQAQRLKNDARTEAVQLYLGQLENGHDDTVSCLQTSCLFANKSGL